MNRPPVEPVIRMTQNNSLGFGLAWTKGVTNYMRICSEIMSYLVQYTKLASEVADTYALTNNIAMKKYENLYGQAVKNMSNMELV